MTRKILTALAFGALLSGCSCDAPEVAEVSLGCPGSVREFCEVAGDRVFFDFDKHCICPEGKATLEKQAEWLQKNPQVTVKVAGFCDERGTVEYNIGLGERRANAASSYLRGLGVGADRLTECSMGKTHPIVAGSTEKEWAQNRVAVSVLSNAKEDAAVVCVDPCDPCATPVVARVEAVESDEASTES